jgi:hypothetical protein
MHAALAWNLRKKTRDQTKNLNFTLAHPVVEGFHRY